MDESTQNTVRAAEQAVNQLIHECRKSGLLYQRHPNVVAQVSRTGKWLLSAITGLRRAESRAADQPHS